MPNDVNMKEARIEHKFDRQNARSVQRKD